MEISKYRVITSSITVVVDADATSATISWEYVCDYKENGCEYCDINGIESEMIELSPNTTCEEKETSGDIQWEGNEISYTIIQKPNIIIYDEPQIDYIIKTISGTQVIDNQVNFSDELSCGDAFEKTVNVTYSSNTHSNSCSLPYDNTGNTNAQLVFDCSDTSNGGMASGITTILNNDIVYTYKCEQCIGVTCETETFIDEINITSLKIGDEEIAAVPCSGANGVSCDISYKIVNIDSKCERSERSESTSIILDVPPCEGLECCKKHQVPIQITLNGIPTNIYIPVEADFSKICYNGCGEHCGSYDKAEIVSWRLRYNNKEYTEENIDELPVIPITVTSLFYFYYTLNVTSVTETCEDIVYSETSGGSVVTIDGSDCRYKDYIISIIDFKGDGCEIEKNVGFRFHEAPYVYPIDEQVEQIEGWFVITKYKKGDEWVSLKMKDEDYPYISFVYEREKCREYPPY